MIGPHLSCNYQFLIIRIIKIIGVNHQTFCHKIHTQMPYEWPFQRNLVPPHGVTSQWENYFSLFSNIFHITSWKQWIFNSQCHIDVSSFQNVYPEIVHIGYGQFLVIAVFSLSFRLLVSICCTTTVLSPVRTYAGCRCPSL